MINFVSINNFSAIPVLRYVIEDLSNLFCINIIHCKIESQPFNLNVKYKEICVGTFRNTSDFNNQTTVFKIIKYVRIYIELLRICIRRKQIIISQDYQVISIILSNYYLLRPLGNRLIYYQFELFDFDHLSKKDKRMVTRMITNIDMISLAIFPEINRLKYFCDIARYPAERTFIFPNTCNTPQITKNCERRVEFSHIPKGATVFGHVGNIGPDHYIKEFLKVIDEILDPEVYFVMVGRHSKEIISLFSGVKNSNLIVINELPHSELRRIYPVIDYGLILYKGVDKNFEYCAPNKLYEYWSYGIPVISHKVSGLTGVINDSLLGVTINFESIEFYSTLIRLSKEPKPNKESTQDYFCANLSITSYLNKLRGYILSI